MVEITSEEQNQVKIMKRTEDSLRDLWDNIKCTDIWIIGVSEEEEKNKGFEKTFEEIIVENFPNMGKEIVNQVQETQRVPYSENTTTQNVWDAAKAVLRGKFRAMQSYLKESIE